MLIFSSADLFSESEFHFKPIHLCFVQSLSVVVGNTPLVISAWDQSEVITDLFCSTD